MRNNNYLSLINFKVKLHRQRHFFINEHDVRGSIFLCCQHGVTWSVSAPCLIGVTSVVVIKLPNTYILVFYRAPPLINGYVSRNS